MRRLRFRIAALAALVLFGAAASTASAHHAVYAEFNLNKKVELTGVLTQVDWVNPHVYFHFMIREKNGKYTPWLFQSPSPSLLKRAGMPGKEDYKVGATYSIVTNPARNGAHVGTFGMVTFPDGRKLNIAWVDPTARPD